MANTRSLAEAIRWMNEQEPVKHGELRELIIRETLSNNPDQDVIKPLLRAYNAATARYYEEETEKECPDLLTKEEVEQVFAKEWRKGYKDGCPGASAEYINEACCALMPEGVIYADALYLPGIIKALGYAVGYKDGRRTVQFSEYFKREETHDETVG